MLLMPRVAPPIWRRDRRTRPFAGIVVAVWVTGRDHGAAVDDGVARARRGVLTGRVLSQEHAGHIRESQGSQDSEGT